VGFKGIRNLNDGELNIHEENIDGTWATVIMGCLKFVVF
jgi:hypothetical protein